MRVIALGSLSMPRIGLVPPARISPKNVARRNSASSLCDILSVRGLVPRNRKKVAPEPVQSQSTSQKNTNKSNTSLYLCGELEVNTAFHVPSQLATVDAPEKTTRIWSSSSQGMSRTISAETAGTTDVLTYCIAIPLLKSVWCEQAGLDDKDITEEQYQTLQHIPPEDYPLLSRIGNPINLFNGGEDFILSPDIVVNLLNHAKQNVENRSLIVNTLKKLVEDRNKPRSSQEFQESWKALCKGETAQMVESMGSNPYHNISHFGDIAECMSQCPEVPPKLAAILTTMGYFHDAVQDQGPGKNEEDSLKKVITLSQPLLEGDTELEAGLNAIGKMTLIDATEMQGCVNATRNYFILKLQTFINATEERRTHPFYRKLNAAHDPVLGEIYSLASYMATADLYSGALLSTKSLTFPNLIDPQVKALIKEHPLVFKGALEQGIKMMGESDKPIREDFRKIRTKLEYELANNPTRWDDIFQEYKEKLTENTTLRNALLDQINDLKTFWSNKHSHLEINAMMEAYGIKDTPEDDYKFSSKGLQNLAQRVRLRKESISGITHFPQVATHIQSTMTTFTEDQKTELAVYLLWISANSGRRVSVPQTSDTTQVIAQAQTRLDTIFHPKKSPT